jgi:hypothetical protein
MSKLHKSASFMDKDIVSRLRDFIEDEMRSCSMDSGCITPEYVYRMWGGEVPIEEIEAAMAEVRCTMYDER